MRRGRPRDQAQSSESYVWTSPEDLSARLGLGVEKGPPPDDYLQWFIVGASFPIAFPIGLVLVDLGFPFSTAAASF